MIDAIDQRLQDWIKTALGDGDGEISQIKVSLAAPSSAATEPCVNLYLIDLIDSPPARGERQTPLQIGLRYLVTTWSQQPEEAHNLLGKLVFAALARSDLEVELGPLPDAAWNAFGIPPRPCFRLALPLRVQRPQPEARIVHEVVLQTLPITDLEGVVIGPNQTPLADARIELPGLARSASTDAGGRFHLPAVPAGLSLETLRVRAKGKVLAVTVHHDAGGDQPLVIHCNETEA